MTLITTLFAVFSRAERRELFLGGNGLAAETRVSVSTAINRVLTNHVNPAAEGWIFQVSQNGGDIVSDGFENGMGPWSSSIQ